MLCQKADKKVNKKKRKGKIKGEGTTPSSRLSLKGEENQIKRKKNKERQREMTFFRNPKLRKRRTKRREKMLPNSSHGGKAPMK